METKEVGLLTTAHDANKVATGKTNPVTKKAIKKFKAVHDYNQYMGAVDRSGGLDSSVGSGFAPWPRGCGFETQRSTVWAPTGWVGVSIM
ncbi:hypothetical protein ElyMa_006625800 [Elysia marginata]|uniref:Uncharacterized protein n=1 Tax=Elysia marginata TaxID=1093978 RepID=A0AAV4IM61_9GAST|nr:hypothetical protein ElyMa_006625800 [Elysia marginata]